MPANRRASLRALAAAALVAVALAGCGGSAEEVAAPVIVDVDGALQEYRDAQADLELPPAARWPDFTPTLTPSADAGLFEYGVGIQEAQSVWYCAWAREATSGSADQQAAAIAKLTEFSTQFGADGKFAKGDPSLQTYYSRIEEASGLGDQSLLQQHVETDCATL